ncbi:MAG: hypothetical protein HOE90_11445 [Bacteriovoracaceae bacterium]|jgi:hypothetical protein|nr:hypothetical protein [Bacteriovoracaceae bacterium]
MVQKKNKKILDIEKNGHSLGYVSSDVAPGYSSAGLEEIGSIDQVSQFDEIYAVDVLQRVSHLHLNEFLTTLNCALNPTGVLKIKAPDFHHISTNYQRNADCGSFVETLLGSKNEVKSVFDKPFLEKIIKESGFSKVTKWEEKGDDIFFVAKK